MVDHHCLNFFFTNMLWNYSYYNSEHFQSGSNNLLIFYAEETKFMKIFWSLCMKWCLVVSEVVETITFMVVSSRNVVLK